MCRRSRAHGRLRDAVPVGACADRPTGRMRPVGSPHMCGPLESRGREVGQCGPWLRARPFERAPRWRETGAGARRHGARSAALSWLARRRDSSAWTARSRGCSRWPEEVLREQLRTPGQLLLGTRTVDRRTGARVALWRTLVLPASQLRGQGADGRLVVREPVRSRSATREAFLGEMHELMQHAPAGLSGAGGCSGGAVRPPPARLVGAESPVCAQSRRGSSSVSSTPACAAASPRRSRCSPGRAEITGRRSGR